jgi:hypothetical protein
VEIPGHFTAHVFPLMAVLMCCASCLTRYNEGVSDLQGSSIRRARPPQLLWDDGSAVAGGPAAAAVQTWINTLLVDRGVSYEVRASQLESVLPLLQPTKQQLVMECRCSSES